MLPPWFKKSPKQPFKKTRFYAFLDDLIEPAEGVRPRTGYLFDCVRADDFDAGANLGPEILSLIRIITTPERLSSLFRLPRAPRLGDWLEIWIGDKARHPMAWHLPAEADYIPEFRTNLVQATLLPDPDGTVDGTNRERRLGARLRSAARLTAEELSIHGSEADLPNLLEGECFGWNVCVLDVGQASCAAIVVDNQIRAFFDVGRPVWPNHESWGSPHRVSPPTDAFVILSHWDQDHFALARTYPEFKRLRWFAPDQPVGFNTLSFQRDLGPKLTFLSANTYQGAGPDVRMILQRCTGSNLKDRNQTGYCLRLEDDQHACLLTGDADYDVVPANQKIGLDAVVIPHHGGKGSSSVPPAASGGRAVVSYGIPNKYKHANESRIADHDDANWRIFRTAAHERSWRGSRWLYPPKITNHLSLWTGRGRLS